MISIPRTMSTQHPDNVRLPWFVPAKIFTLETETIEALWVFKMGCHEQMWDYEGKKSDREVVPELLALDKDFFQEHPLGQKKFLTIRLPNPEIELDRPKLILEVLASILNFSDFATQFYDKESIPIFEVILPMTTSAEQLNRIYWYYVYMVKQENSPVLPGDIPIGQWLGKFRPKTINVIPLFEDMTSLLNAAKITETYLKDKIENNAIEYQRVFLARSDPALNYGSLAAVLSLNVALQRLDRLEKKLGIPIYPILGMGSPPFRGNFKPTTVEKILSGYPSCQTFTIQSAFKYDWPQEVVAQAIKKINSAQRAAPFPVDEEKSIYLAKKTKTAYQEQIPHIAYLVNELSSYIPRRRLRRLHIGLFGYCRVTAGVRLPRAIPFCASLYSIGLPPEILGLHCLNSEDLRLIKELYPSPNFEEDLKDALAFYNPDVLQLLSTLMREQIEKTLKIVDFEINTEHQKITSQIIDCLKKNQTDRLEELIEIAGQIRKFLG